MAVNEINKQVAKVAGERKVDMTKRTMNFAAIGCACAALIVLIAILKGQAAESYQPILTILQYFLIAIGAIDGTFKAANVGEHASRK